MCQRSLSRKGNVYFKQKKWADAIKWFDKSLTDHRNQAVIKKRSEVGPTPPPRVGVVVSVCCDGIG